ncbi:MAG: FKBP-type peptidyl-prolyl cis-trans isomerase [Actinomycetota bacterium]|nr:FKBP-type peptidyl-prolyl cis-trans isomerase [Actinomycetota bacterium]
MDIVVGHGPGAVNGQQLTVKYVGVTYADGKEFDSSWSRGASSTFPFPLGGHQVISGWDLGMVGAKVGGRRELVIPAPLGYGEQGTQGIPPNAALVFVVDVVNIA